jgi:DNA-directed RNA polymerase subunit beta
MIKTTGQLDKKTFAKFRESGLEVPNLMQHQVDSFDRFLEVTLKKIFLEFSPITDYADKKFDLAFKSYRIEKTDVDEFQARKQKMSMQHAVKATYELINKTTGSKKEQEVFMFSIPVMTSHGTFVVNGVERVIVPQLARSFGIFFTVNDTKKERQFGAKVIPARGS